jgi:hypothetical protein
MPALVDGVTYKSNASLRAAWKARLAVYVSGKGKSVPKRVDVEEEDAAWFLQVARLCPSHSSKLLNKPAPSNVFVDRADLPFGEAVCALPASKLPRGISKHLRHHACLYAEFPGYKLCSLSSKLELKPRIVDRHALLLAWLRRGIQCQIDEFRSAARSSARCHLCDKSLVGRMNHVDHGTGTRSFKHISSEFLATKHGVQLQGITRLGSNSAVSLGCKWQSFHRKHAILAMACVSCNLTTK